MVELTVVVVPNTVKLPAIWTVPVLSLESFGLIVIVSALSDVKISWFCTSKLPPNCGVVSANTSVATTCHVPSLRKKLFAWVALPASTKPAA